MCDTKPLASAGAFRLESCGRCQALSVHLGPVTVRLDPAALRTLHQLLAEAVRRLPERETCSLVAKPPSGLN